MLALVPVHKILRDGNYKGVREPKSLMDGKPLIVAVHKVYVALIVEING